MYASFPLTHQDTLYTSFFFFKWNGGASKHKETFCTHKKNWNQKIWKLQYAKKKEIESAYAYKVINKLT